MPRPPRTPTEPSGRLARAPPGAGPPRSWRTRCARRWAGLGAPRSPAPAPPIAGQRGKPRAHDLREHRPGYAAGLRARVRSPLAEVGMTKTEVRAASRDLGLPTWDAPAAPCLSSRVVYGLEITPSRLAQVEQAEAYLRELGVTGDLRVRHHGERARVEVEPRWVPWLEQRLDAVTQRLRDVGFTIVEIDPRGYRRGSLLQAHRPRA